MLIWYGHYFIALCAVASYAQTAHLMGVEPDAVYMLFLGAATLGVYNLHSLMSLRKLQNTNIALPSRFEYVYIHQLWYQWTCGGAALVAIICYVWLPVAVRWAVVAPALLTLGYVLPLWRRGMRRLRDVPFVKPLIIGLVWAWATVFIAEILAGVGHRWAWWLERAMYIAALALPFDIRDVEMDLQNGVQTWANRIGVRNTLLLTTCLLMGWVCMLPFVYASSVALVLAGSGVLTLLSVWTTVRIRASWFYVGWLDGLIVLQWVCVALLTKK